MLQELKRMRLQVWQAVQDLWRLQFVESRHECPPAVTTFHAAAAAGRTGCLSPRYKNRLEEEEHAAETQLCSGMPRLRRSRIFMAMAGSTENSAFTGTWAGIFEKSKHGHGLQTHGTLCALCTS